MTVERLRILNLVAEGKITADEAASLLDALGGGRGEEAPAGSAAPETGQAAPPPRYLRVVVEDPGSSDRVNVRVPINLLRAGVRLAALLPSGVTDQVNRSFAEKGFDVDLSRLSAKDLDGLLEHLGELTVDVEGSKGEKVRVFCE